MTLSTDVLHDNVGYTPYEGMKVRGWPTTVISRGDVIVDDGTLFADRGRGEFLRCELPSAAKPLERPAREFDPQQNFGVDLR